MDPEEHPKGSIARATLTRNLPIIGDPKELEKTIGRAVKKEAIDLGKSVIQHGMEKTFDAISEGSGIGAIFSRVGSGVGHHLGGTFAEQFESIQQSMDKQRDSSEIVTRRPESRLISQFEQKHEEEEDPEMVLLKTSVANIFQERRQRLAHQLLGGGEDVNPLSLTALRKAETMIKDAGDQIGMDFSGMSIKSALDKISERAEIQPDIREGITQLLEQMSDEVEDELEEKKESVDEVLDKGVLFKPQDINKDGDISAEEVAVSKAGIELTSRMELFNPLMARMMREQLDPDIAGLGRASDRVKISRKKLTDESAKKRSSQVDLVQQGFAGHLEDQNIFNTTF